MKKALTILTLLLLLSIGAFTAELKPAIDALGARESTLTIYKQYEVTENLVIPANITLNFLQGGSLDVANGKTLTINGYVIASALQIFTGAGTVTLNTYPHQEAWWGNPQEFDLGTGIVTTSGSIISSGTNGVISGSTANTGTVIIYDGSDHKMTITLPGIAASYVLIFPIDDGAATEFLGTDGAGNLSWAVPAGTGNVTAGANLADHTIIRGDGGGVGVEDTGITIDDTDNLTGIVSITGNTHLDINSSTPGTDYVRSESIYTPTTAADANVYISSGASGYSIIRSTSALKYKENVTDLELDSALIYNLRPVSFNSKSKADDKSRRFIGLIADEIADEIPEIIIYNEFNEPESYDNRMLMTLILSEIQKLRGEIETLKNQIKVLEKK